MAARSTRNKIRYNAKRILECFDDMESYLQTIDELADGRSDYITNNIPGLVEILEHVKPVFVQFREGL